MKKANRNITEQECPYCNYFEDKKCPYCNDFGKRLLLHMSDKTHFFQYQEDVCVVCEGAGEIDEEIITIKEDWFKDKYKDVKINTYRCKSCFGKGHQLRMIVKSECNYCKIEDNITIYKKRRKWHRLFRAFDYAIKIVCPECFNTKNIEEFDVDIYLNKEDKEAIEKEGEYNVV